MASPASRATGAGKNYKSKTVMEDRAKSIENGMVYPATKNCALCHNEQSPDLEARPVHDQGRQEGRVRCRAGLRENQAPRSECEEVKRAVPVLD